MPPEGAPNVLIVLLDDVGFGASTAFGGPCATPNAEKFAAGGLSYNRFHTTALCAPTRCDAQRPQPPPFRRDGLDHRDGHSAPGNSSVRPNTKARWR
nr:sulfatase-like hydrolase/transferase [Candidatus Microthrix sp.]